MSEKVSMVQSFNSTNGQTPEGSLCLDVSTGIFYGQTYKGGLGNGVLYSLDITTNEIKGLHSFSRCLGKHDKGGIQPRHGFPALFNANLYGMTLIGGVVSDDKFGSNGNGTVYQFNLNEVHGYQNLYEFSGTSSNGSNPHSCVVIDEYPDPPILYGFTQLGGGDINNIEYPGGPGIIFGMQLDGSDFQVLYKFEQATGCQPHGQPVFGTASNGDRLIYGMARIGGDLSKNDPEHSNEKGLGVVFSFNLNTTNNPYTVMHQFEGGAGGGATPYHGNPVEYNGKLYGLTHYGGHHNKGVIFSVDTTEKNGQYAYQCLHEFGEISDDGKHPLSSLTLVESIPGETYLYGTAGNGGAYSGGIVFRIKPDEIDSYEIVASLDDSTGSSPACELVEFNGYLYGTARKGGEYGDGAIFKVSLD